MKYQADIDEADANTSHHLMLDLVGSDKRVLDVGCATGYLARALVAQGCTVSGVELDPEAAAEARPSLTELVVGDLEHLDLTEAFGARAFDAVVFGDVLEHLSDPLTVLRASLGLLDEGGFVVVSIPNVAHGSVRLALLKGNFEYRSLGLLDSTHLRFFTRDSLDALLRDAQLMPVDFRRTKAGFFETEIPLQEGDYPSALLATLSADPEVRTYQFVVKAIPVDSSPALRRMYQENAGQTAEIARMRRVLDAVRAAGHAEALPVQVGVLGHFGLDDLRSALLSRIVPGELARRFPVGSIRRFAPTAPGAPAAPTGPTTPTSPTTIEGADGPQLRIDGGEPIEPLGPWSRARAEELAAQLDAVVVTGPLGVPPSVYGGAGSHDRLSELDAALFEGFGADLEETCPVLCLGVEIFERSPVPVDQITAALATHRYLSASDPQLSRPGSVGQEDPDTQVLPDPLFLVGRFYRAELLRLRAAYLRLMGWYPESGPVIAVQGDGDLVDFSPALARVLDAIAAKRGARCVLVESKLVGDDASFAKAIVDVAGHRAGVVPIDAGVVDLLAVVANADAVIASSPGLLAVGFALGRPCVGLDLRDHGRLQPFALAAGIPDAIVRKPTEIVTALDHSPTPQVLEATLQKLQLRLDLHFDQVAAAIAEASRARRASNDAPFSNLSLATQMNALQTAHDALMRRMAAERLAFADRAVALERRTQDDLRQARVETAEAEERIRAIYATRTMRTLHPARELYARLRARPR